MIEVSLRGFNIYAIALPRGHGFGGRRPYKAWETEDGRGFAIITRHADNGSLVPAGVLQ